MRLTIDYANMTVRRIIMKVKKVIGRSLLVLLCIVVVIAIIGIAQFHHRSNPKNLKQYETNLSLIHI